MARLNGALFEGISNYTDPYLPHPHQVKPVLLLLDDRLNVPINLTRKTLILLFQFITFMIINISPVSTE